MRADLREKSNSFEVRLLTHYAIYWSILQVDETMLLTMYCNKERGNGSPTLRLSRGKGDRCLFRVVEGEFEYLWKKARPLTDKTKELP